jgi:predicted amidophosphoribosyltransferase
VQGSDIGLAVEIEDSMITMNDIGGNSCPACGEALPDGAKFCMECGEKLT